MEGWEWLPLPHFIDNVVEKVKVIGIEGEKSERKDKYFIDEEKNALLIYSTGNAGNGSNGILSTGIWFLVIPYRHEFENI